MQGQAVAMLNLFGFHWVPDLIDNNLTRQEL